MNVDHKLREECAVFGVSVTTDDAAGIAYNALLALQHRGQEGSGIAVTTNNKIVYHKNTGLVSEVFSDEVLKRFPKSPIAVGHNRYSTTGNNTKENTGPFITEFLTGRIATAHNGNIINAKTIKQQLQQHGLHFNTTSDSEVISSLIAYSMMKQQDSIQGVVQAAQQLWGAFSLIIMLSDNRLIALRDPNGYRPLCIGKNALGVAVASESCALDSCGFTLVGDVHPGEIVVIQDGSIVARQIALPQKQPNCGLCIFEYVYFSRTDSLVDGLSVYKARYNMGVQLAREYPVEADVVCGVPDTGLEAAIGYSIQSGIPLATGFVKNRYIGRSFIYPTQSQRENAVRLKLNPLQENVKGKKVVLVDDSIVRGTTSEKIVRSLKNAGAKEVHLRISSPPFRYSCHFGTDIDSEENLIANRMSIEEICKKINADSLGHISIQGLVDACASCTIPFCTHCFEGNHCFKKTQKNALES